MRTSTLTILALVACFFAANAATRPLKVSSSELLGDVTDSRFDCERDGGYSGVINGTVYWVYQDSMSFTKPDGKFAGFYTNSATRSSNLKNATDVREITLNPWGGASQFVPHTAEEKKKNIDGGHRWALWPTAPSPTVAGKGVIFFSRVYVNTTKKTEQYLLDGVGLAQIDTSTNPPTVTRPVETFFPAGTGITNPKYGEFNSISDGGYIYAYGKYQDALYVARAPVAQATVLSAYKYYNAKTQAWESTAPSTADTSAAILVGTKLACGTIYYSEFHGAYVFAYMNGYADSKFFGRTGPTPMGPWGPEVTLLITKPMTGRYNYHGNVHPEYDSTGATLVLSYSRPKQERPTVIVTAVRITFA